jgi:hypothetical protein
VKRLLLLLTLSVVASVTALAADAAGEWKCVTVNQTLTIKQDSAKLTGTLKNSLGTLRIAEGKIEGDKISLTFMVVLSNGVDPLKIAGYDSLAEEGQVTEIHYTGTLSGTEVKFKVTQERLDTEREFVFRKSS